MLLPIIVRWLQTGQRKALTLNKHSGWHWSKCNRLQRVKKAKDCKKNLFANDHISVCFTLCEDGSVSPPMVIFRNWKPCSNYAEIGPEGTLYASSQSGFMNGERYGVTAWWMTDPAVCSSSDIPWLSLVASTVCIDSATKVCQCLFAAGQMCPPVPKSKALNRRTVGIYLPALPFSLA